MPLYDIVNKYWKPLIAIGALIVLGTESHGRLEATELLVSEHDDAIEINDQELELFKQWIITQESLNDKFQEQLLESTELNKQLLQYLLEQRGQ